MIIKSKNSEILGDYQLIVIEPTMRKENKYGLFGYTVAGNKALLNSYDSIEEAKADLQAIYNVIPGAISFDGNSANIA